MLQLSGGIDGAEDACSADMHELRRTFRELPELFQFPLVKHFRLLLNEIVLSNPLPELFVGCQTGDVFGGVA